MTSKQEVSEVPGAASTCRQMPETGFMRLPQIIGDPKADPPIPPLIPVGKSTWWAGVKSGRYPPAIKLGPHTTAWAAEAIRALIADMTAGLET